MTHNAQTISVGVIGVGGMGGVHALNLQANVPGARVAAVMDIDRARAAEIAAACDSAQIFTDAHELMQAETVEAVLIASPDETHAEFVLECLRLQKPVFCEKPLAAKLAGAQQIVEAEVGLGRRLVQVGFVRRFDEQHLSLKRVVEAGSLGRPILFKGWHRTRTVPPQTGSEMVLVNSAIHDFDSARWLLGQEIEEVFVRGANTEPARGQETLDLQLIQMTLSGGCLAAIEVYVTATYGYEVGVEIVGEKGTALIGPAHGPVVRSNRTQARAVDQDWLERFKAAYVTELQIWIDRLRGQEQPVPNAWDGYLSLLAAQSCITALRSGAPQRLPSPARPSLYSYGQ